VREASETRRFLPLPFLADPLEETVFTQINPVAFRAMSIALAVVLIVALLPNVTPVAVTGPALKTPVRAFERVAIYDVPGQVAEIVASTPDGETLIYSDSVSEEIGFVRITAPQHPTNSSSLKVPGESPSVAVTPDGTWAMVTVHGSSQYVLVVLDLATRTVHTTFVLGGQPDSVTISPDGRYAAIAVENKHDEELNDGAMPQSSPGVLTIVDLAGSPSSWTTRHVSLNGLAERFPYDPEPEYVSINTSNQVAATLRENNSIVIVDLVAGKVATHWSAGTTTHLADTVEDEDNDI
jgi:DNA-binding beta-propeller fold protein YncE